MKKLIIAVIVIVGLIGLYLVTSSSRGSDVPSGTTSKLIPIEEISHAHGLAVDVANAKKIYIATHEGLFVLKDETDLYQIGTSRDDYMGFSVHPSEPNVFFTSGHPVRGGNMGVQKSEDGGFTWKKISNGARGPVDFHAMAISSANPDIMYGWYSGNLQRSEDGGRSWEIVNSEIRAMALTTSPKNKDVVYAATPTGVLVSTDQGESWKSISQELEGGVVTAFAVDPNNASEMVAFSQVLGGFGKSTDGGITWQQIEGGFKGSVIHIAYDKNTPGTLYAITQANNLYKSTNGGTAWNLIR